MPRDTRKTKALHHMRNLLAQGWDSAALVIDATAEALGGDDAQKIARAVWAEHFEVKAA